MAAVATARLPVREKADSPDASAPEAPVAFGHELRDKHFLFDPSYRNLNHGSFGTIPRPIQSRLRTYQEYAEARPDPFIRYAYPKLLDESRAAVAKLLNVPTDTCVFVANATVGVNTVLRNLVWNEDGKDEILFFDTVYGGCGKTIAFVCEASRGLVAPRQIPVRYPCSDDAVVAAFRAGVSASLAGGKRPRVALFDVVSSVPGVRVPWEALCAACREHGVLSLVDGAQGVGMVDIDLAAGDPDFFVSNCHKWLFVPRGCAVFYVPERNQPLMRSTLPTSHGFVPREDGPAGALFQPSPLPPSSKPRYVANFEFVGTLDNAPYLCVKDSIRWREEVLGGEERIREALTGLARSGGKRAAEILGTHVLDNEERTLTRCAMVNVALPLALGEAAGADGPGGKDSTATMPRVPASDASAVINWILETLMSEHDTFVALFTYDGRFWARLSAQVYLDLSDFAWAGERLKEVCARAAAGEYKQ
ncbi:hypothetical protein VTJ83DRAFT_5213 [Remersonia thermophila]|uniref:Aminotransferase class V domain-containing protein n=1 Tax=Remersonia thermophila TaxID=72144 RepID=A0ABR4DDN6_9PEZI